MAKQSVVQPEARVENSARDLDERMNELSQRIRASDRGRGAVRARPRIDINDAVAQIARRRQELDAQAASAAPPEPEPQKRNWRNFGVDAPAPRPPEPPAPSREVVAENAARESAAQELSAAALLQAEIRKLSQRLDELRREQSEKRETPAAGIDVLRAELAAMSRSLADLAPRNAVVALEGAIRDLSQRVAASRESGARENLLAPVEGLVAGLREALRAHDPRPAVEALQREIAAIRARVEGIAETSVDPQSFENIRRQVEETRTLLGALAQRPMPLDRLERQIGELADRIDRLSTSSAPQHDSAVVALSLAEARSQVERSTPPSALTSIEWRLEQIATKMDQALERPLPAPTLDPGALEDLARRIDAVRETIETRYATPVVAPLDTILLEQTMREISAKLDRPIAAAIDPNAFESMMQDLGARIDRRASPVIDTAPLEQVLRKLGERPAALDTRPLEGLMREISAKLDKPNPPAIDPGAFEELIHDLGARIDRRSDSAADVDAGSIEDLMREINAKLDRPAAPVVDVAIFEGMIRDLATRIDRRPDPVIDTTPLEQTLSALHEKIDRGVASDAVALERMVAELLAQLDETRRALAELPSAAANPAAVDESFVRGLADLRAEQSNSDRRMQSTLGGVHDMLETLVDRIGQIEDDVARVNVPPQSGSGKPASTASYSAASPMPASAALNSMDATIREAPALAAAEILAGTARRPGDGASRAAIFPRRADTFDRRVGISDRAGRGRAAARARNGRGRRRKPQERGQRPYRRGAPRRAGGHRRNGGQRRQGRGQVFAELNRKRWRSRTGEIVFRHAASSNSSGRRPCRALGDRFRRTRRHAPTQHSEVRNQLCRHTAARERDHGEGLGLARSAGQDWRARA